MSEKVWRSRRPAQLLKERLASTFSLVVVGSSSNRPQSVAEYRLTKNNVKLSVVPQFSPTLLS